MGVLIYSSGQNFPNLSIDMLGNFPVTLSRPARAFFLRSVSSAKYNRFVSGERVWGKINVTSGGAWNERRIIA